MTGPEQVFIAHDTPLHRQGEDTSSIGGLGEPQPSNNGRLKGFYIGGVVADQVAHSLALSEFQKGLSRLDSDLTRVQHRIIYNKDFLVGQVSLIAPYVEAIVALDSGHLGNNPALVYLAKNTSQRQPNVEDLATIRNNVARAKQERSRSISQLLEKSNRNGFSVEILDKKARTSEDVRVQMYQLYKRFRWEEDDVSKILNNENAIIAVVRDKDRIVSAGIAELAQVPIGNTFLRMAEITEAATLSEYENKGLYTGISTTLILELRKRSLARNIFGGEIDLIFGECNGLSFGVLFIAAHQGRVFATDTGASYGFGESGILKQQVPIEGPVRKTPYNDLVVTYLTRSMLYAMK